MLKNKQSQKGIALIWIIVAVTLLITGVGVVRLRKQVREVEKSQPEEIGREADKESKKLVGELKDLIASGIPMKCTYVGEGFTTISYIRGNRQYSETKVEGGATIYTIIKDNCLWNWYQGEDQGTTLCLEENMLETAKKYNPTMLNEEEHGCVAASFSESQFNPPSHINFTNIEEAPPKPEEDLLKVLPPKERSELESAIRQAQEVLNSIQPYNPSDIVNTDDIVKGLEGINEQTRKQIQKREVKR